VTLVIKTINAKAHAEEFAHLKASVADLPDVVFLTDFLSRQEVYELQACCDVLLSLHRAEGFGLAPAEMMFMGKPVIATGWSGNMDFMTPMNSYPVNYELKPLDEAKGVYEAGPVWAEADVEHAAFCLRQVMDDRAKAAEIGRRAAADIRRTHSPEAVGREMRKRLNLLADLYQLG
jgi:glycosyltransferase involved in cell wall biosynthesis